MCSWCLEAKAWLEANGLKYTAVNVGSDAVARQRAIEISGQSLVPVIEVDDHVLGDFDVNQLQAFLQQQGYLDPAA